MSMFSWSEFHLLISNARCSSSFCGRETFEIQEYSLSESVLTEPVQEAVVTAILLVFSSLHAAHAECKPTDEFSQAPADFFLFFLAAALNSHTPRDELLHRLY